MVDLTTRWLGLTLRSPLVVGASPISDNLDTARQLADVGAGALVLRSVFEEQIVAEQLATYQFVDSYSDLDAETSGFFPDAGDTTPPPLPILAHLTQLKSAVDIPVIASLNGTTPGGWTSYARQLQNAGADAIELNLYDIATRLDETGQIIETRQLDTVRAVVDAVEIPVSVKLSPFYASVPGFVAQLQQAGAAGVVLFNRFYQPDLDLDRLSVDRALVRSTPAELPLRLHALALLHERTGLDLAASGGVHRGTDAAKAIVCGAHVVQIVSALLDDPPTAMALINDELTTWLDHHRYATVADARGTMALDNVADRSAWERLNYARILDSSQARTRRQP